MHRDTIADWQSLTKLYREMGDEELLELAADINDLTEMAQQVLCDEMRSRGLKDAPDAVVEPKQADFHQIENFVEREEDDSERSDEPCEYTWKTLLYECNTPEEATPIRLALRQAGIDSWIQGQGYRIAPVMDNPRILVAADQLEQAREILSKPIPQAIIEQTKTPIPEYVPPVCPKCGAEDPTLEGADPVNSWLCESCGYQWSDPAEVQSETTA
jgi:hypothetical protein